METINLIFPHQLFRDHEMLDNGNPVFLIEEHLFFKEFNFHKLKIAFHRTSMKRFQAFLENRGLIVHYIESTDSDSDIRKLIPALAKKKVKCIHYVDPTDNWLEKRIKSAVEQNGIRLTKYQNPGFINTQDQLASFFRADKKSFFQTTFYKQQRKEYDILLEDGSQPSGGKWTFDVDNRKRYPKDQKPPSIKSLPGNSFWDESVDYVNRYYKSNPGQLNVVPLYPTDHEETEEWLQQFFNQRFASFGDYEDAIVKDEHFLHHSVLSPMLNVGLIQPMELINKAIAFARTNNVPLNSLEGFIRQILGWREFIRGMYECKGTESRNGNYWGHHRKIPNSFYDGTTGIEPIDNTIKKILKTGYCHHIERLMILGNFMLLCEFHPNEVYRWFMELFIDAYDWVMVPNIYGMSQFADGGLFATKPYIGGSNYLMKMSNYKKGEWQDIWDGLFWRFMDKNRLFFLKNPRLKMLINTLDKMDPERKRYLISSSEEFLTNLK